MEATFYLAQAYRSGSPEMGLPKDLRAFGEMVQQAASGGSADALFALGGAFFHGEDGFARDPRAAFRCVSSVLLCFVLFKREKERGSQNTHVNISTMTHSNNRRADAPTCTVCPIAVVDQQERSTGSSQERQQRATTVLRSIRRVCSPFEDEVWLVCYLFFLHVMIPFSPIRQTCP